MVPAKAKARKEMPGTEGMLLATSLIWFSSSQPTPTSRVTQELKLEDCEEGEQLD